MCYVVYIEHKEEPDEFICYLHDKEMAEAFCFDWHLIKRQEAKVAPLPLLQARELKIPWVEKVWEDLYATRSR